MSDSTVTTNATCSKQYDWMFNSLGQSPCVVTSHLFTSCGDGCIENIDSCVIPAALSPGTNYTNLDDVDLGFTFEYGVCTCSTVWYSTLSACAVCQGRGLAIDPWIVYSAQCKPLYIQKFSDTIPNGTAVPGWAFLPIADDMFDLKTAQALAALHPAENQAPTVIPGQLSSTTLPITTTLPTSTHSGTPTSTSSSNPGPVVKKKNLAGIIAGSVVGGGVFFVGLAVILFCCVRRRRRALYADNLVARHDLLLLPDPSDAASPASRSGPAPLVPSQQPKSATVARSFGTHSGSSANHTVLADVAGFPAPRSPAAATAVNPASSPMTSSSAAALASWSSQSSLIGRVRSGGAAGASHGGPEQEADSGWREGRPSATLPPPYTPD
ncbi:hypothetical protein LXA43DRAFT_355268 [Ganoderma leucocontextum]|nr:hypothetical protein LXA43DRAFT_355268 [Ganoderma leucocontextum]